MYDGRNISEKKVANNFLKVLNLFQSRVYV